MRKWGWYIGTAAGVFLILVAALLFSSLPDPGSAQQCGEPEMTTAVSQLFWWLARWHTAILLAAAALLTGMAFYLRLAKSGAWPKTLIALAVPLAVTLCTGWLVAVKRASPDQDTCVFQAISAGYESDLTSWGRLWRSHQSWSSALFLDGVVACLIGAGIGFGIYCWIRSREGK